MSSVAHVLQYAGSCVLAARRPERPGDEHRPAKPSYDYTRVMPTKEDVLQALHRVEDPELGMDIVDLGLVYDVEIEPEKVKVIHTLTSMGCPAGPMIQEDMRTTVAESFPDVRDIELELTWDPPWTPDKMSDDAKFILGFG